MKSFLLHRTRSLVIFLFCACLVLQAGAQQVGNIELDTATVIEKTELFKRSATDTPLYTERHVPSTEIKKIKSEKKFWYADSSFIKKPGESQEYRPFFDRDWVRTIFWIVLILGFTAALLWYLSGSNVGLFKRKRDIKEEGALNGEMPEDIFAINYEREIDKALAAGDYRLAVRLHFLDLLRKMSERNIIQYRQDKTNLDYLFQLNTRPYYNDLFRVVRHYEYSWYGQFEVSPRAYELIITDFKKLQQELN